MKLAVSETDPSDILYHTSADNAMDTFMHNILICSIHILIQFNSPASWSSGNAFVSGAGGPRFKFRAGQIGHSVANGSPSLRHFFERSCVARAQ